jgi:hypothetical protein
MQMSEASANIKGLLEQQAVLQQRSAASMEADGTSRTDRSQLNERVTRIEGALATETADRRSQNASFGTHLGEVETQFSRESDIGNLRGAQQERINALLWLKTYNEAYPSATFFPPPFHPDGEIK